MCYQHIVQQTSSGRLPAFRQPAAGKQNITVRSPTFCQENSYITMRGFNTYQTPGTNTGFFDMTRWQVLVPATAANRWKTCSWASLLCLIPRLSDPISTFAPTVPTQPAYASITPLPILTPGFRPRSAADFSHNSPTTCPADNQFPFYLSQL